MVSIWPNSGHTSFGPRSCVHPKFDPKKMDTKLRKRGTEIKIKKENFATKNYFMPRFFDSDPAFLPPQIPSNNNKNWQWRHRLQKKAAQMRQTTQMTWTITKNNNLHFGVRKSVVPFYCCESDTRALGVIVIVDEPDVDGLRSQLLIPPQILPTLICPSNYQSSSFIRSLMY